MDHSHPLPSIPPWLPSPNPNVAGCILTGIHAGIKKNTSHARNPLSPLLVQHPQQQKLETPVLTHKRQPSSLHRRPICVTCAHVYHSINGNAVHSVPPLCAQQPCDPNLRRTMLHKGVTHGCSGSSRRATCSASSFRCVRQRSISSVAHFALPKTGSTSEIARWQCCDKKEVCIWEAC